MLTSTPTLKSSINSIALKFVNTIMSGDGITKDNFTTWPQQTANQACQTFSEDLGNALDTWFESVILMVEPGLITIGSPTTQSTIAPFPVSKT